MLLNLFKIVFNEAILHREFSHQSEFEDLLEIIWNNTDDDLKEELKITLVRDNSKNFIDKKEAFEFIERIDKYQKMRTLTKKGKSK